ncbi:MAG: transcription antitermination factor NusB [Candidatus Sumerlaeales bacterium]|nr:transcription antitermination factor NusB [Candidatus Sumerlaeales bacterium]
MGINMNNNRRQARIRALEFLFASDFGDDLQETIKNMTQAMRHSSEEGFPQFSHELLEMEQLHNAEILQDIESCLEKWDISRVGKIEKALLRLGITEIKYFDDIPTRVSINEYIELSKVYCDPDAKRFINGILDTISRRYK